MDQQHTLDKLEYHSYHCVAVCVCGWRTSDLTYNRNEAMDALYYHIDPQGVTEREATMKQLRIEKIPRKRGGA